MGLFHLHMKNISRGDRRSVVAAAAYRAGETLVNEAEEKLSKFAGRREVLHAEIRLPAGAPAWAADRATLWNAVERAEKRKDSRLAKEIEFAIPHQLPIGQWRELVRTMADHYTALGFAVDMSIHQDPSGQNPHAHLLLTTRGFAGEGFGPKIRGADAKAFLKEARALWAKVANAALAGAGSDVVLDPRSYAARGIDQTPGQHRGPDPEARRARREREMTMSDSLTHAYRIVLAEQSVKERFPALAAREDWPPVSTKPTPDMPAATRAELKVFWQAVNERAFLEFEGERAREAQEREPEPAPARTDAPVEPDLEPGPAAKLGRAIADRAEFALARLEARALDLLGESAGARDRREAHEADAFTQDLAALRATIRDMREAIAEQRELSAAFRARYPTVSWDEWDAMQRERAEDRATRFPVPGPDRELITEAQRERAEDAMLQEMHRPDAEVERTPDPNTQPEHERWLVERAILAQGRDRAERTPVQSPGPTITRSTDPDLAWLNDLPASTETAQAQSPRQELDHTARHADRVADRPTPERLNSPAPPSDRWQSASARDPDLDWLGDILNPSPSQEHDRHERERDR